MAQLEAYIAQEACRWTSPVLPSGDHLKGNPSSGGWPNIGHRSWATGVEGGCMYCNRTSIYALILGTDDRLGGGGGGGDGMNSGVHHLWVYWVLPWRTYSDADLEVNKLVGSGVEGEGGGGWGFGWGWGLGGGRVGVEVGVSWARGRWGRGTWSVPDQLISARSGLVTSGLVLEGGSEVVSTRCKRRPVVRSTACNLTTTADMFVLFWVQTGFLLIYQVRL